MITVAVCVQEGHTICCEGFESGIILARRWPAHRLSCKASAASQPVFSGCPNSAIESGFVSDWGCWQQSSLSDPHGLRPALKPSCISTPQEVLSDWDTLDMLTDDQPSVGSKTTEPVRPSILPFRNREPLTPILDSIVLCLFFHIPRNEHVPVKVDNNNPCANWEQHSK